jgi:hypothetical protein
VRIAPVYARFAQAANAPQLATQMERKSYFVDAIHSNGRG